MTSSPNPSTPDNVERQTLPLPNVEKYIGGDTAITGEGNEATPQQAYIARPKRQPNSASKPLGVRPAVSMGNPSVKAFDHSLVQRARQRR